MPRKNNQKKQALVPIDALQLFFDSSVPFKYKLIPIASVLYLVFPLDFLTDLVPVLGYADDVGVAIAGLTLFTTLATKNK